MNSIEIEDYDIVAGEVTYVGGEATYFLLMDGVGVDVTLKAKGTRIGGGKGLQGGDGVGPLSKAFDRIELRSETTQKVKVSTSSDPVTITRLSGTVKVAGVVETAPDYTRTKNRESFIGAVTQNAVSGEFTYCQIYNPAGSGKNIIIPELFITSEMYDVFYTEVEATAANLNNFSERQAIELLAHDPLRQTGTKYMKQGTSSGNALTSSIDRAFGTFTRDGFKLATPFILGPGTGLVVKSNGVEGKVSISAVMFEEQL